MKWRLLGSMPWFDLPTQMGLLGRNLRPPETLAQFRLFAFTVCRAGTAGFRGGRFQDASLWRQHSASHVSKSETWGTPDRDRARKEDSEKCATRRNWPGQTQPGVPSQVGSAPGLLGMTSGKPPRQASLVWATQVSVSPGPPSITVSALSRDTWTCEGFAFPFVEVFVLVLCSSTKARLQNPAVDRSVPPAIYSVT